MTFQIILNPRDARTSLNINNNAKVHKYRTTIAHALSRVALHNIHNYGTSDVNPVMPDWGTNPAEGLFFARFEYIRDSPTSRQSGITASIYDIFQMLKVSVGVWKKTSIFIVVITSVNN